MFQTHFQTHWLCFAVRQHGGPLRAGEHAASLSVKLVSLRDYTTAVELTTTQSNYIAGLRTRSYGYLLSSSNAAMERRGTRKRQRRTSRWEVDFE